MKVNFTIKCTLEDDEKKKIKEVFKENNINLTGYVLSCLIKKTKELSENGNRTRTN